MLTINDYKYFQPVQYFDDGTNVEWGDVPNGMFSFQAFRTEEECRQWLINNNYEPGDFDICEYCNDDIEDLTLIDADGDIIPKIETLSDDEITDVLTDEVLLYAGSIDNLHQMRQSNETMDQFKDRVYGLALDEVNDAISSIEEANEFDFSSYGGNPDTEWYDAARDEAVRQVMGWMLEEYEEEL